MGECSGTCYCNAQAPVTAGTCYCDGDGLLSHAGDLAIGRDETALGRRHGLITSTILRGTVPTTMSYSAYGERSSETADAYGWTIPEGGRDALGRILTKVETVGTETVTTGYEYDAAGRLWKVFDGSTLVAEYTYDDNGNRLTAPGVPLAVYDQQDRLIRQGDVTYTYQPDGRLATRVADGATTSTIYDYDVLGNLRSVTLPNDDRIEYLIDGLNRRVGRREQLGGVWQPWRYYLYADALRVVGEVDESGALVSRYVYATKSNVPDYVVQGTRTFRILSDHLGSPRAVVDVANGDVVERIAHDAWGVETRSAPAAGYEPIVFGFAGGLRDARTGLVRFGARDYDPEVGRWTTKDPISFRGDGGNLFVYTLNNPVNNVDYTGRSMLPPWGLSRPCDIWESDPKLMTEVILEQHAAEFGLSSADIDIGEPTWIDTQHFICMADAKLPPFRSWNVYAFFERNRIQPRNYAIVFIVTVQNLKESYFPYFFDCRIGSI